MSRVGGVHEQRLPGATVLARTFERRRVLGAGATSLFYAGVMVATGVAPSRSLAAPRSCNTRGACCGTGCGPSPCCNTSCCSADCCGNQGSGIGCNSNSTCSGPDSNTWGSGERCWCCASSGNLCCDCRLPAANPKYCPDANNARCICYKSGQAC